MFEAFLNRLKESLAGITVLFGGFATVFASFMQLAAGKNEPEEDEAVTQQRAVRR